MSAKGEPVSVFHQVESLNKLLLILPAAMYIVSYSVAYSIQSHKPEFFPTLTDCNAHFPESRIISVVSTIIAFVDLFLVLVRDRVLLIVAKKKGASEGLIYKSGRTMMDIFLVFGAIGIIVIAVPPKESIFYTIGFFLLYFSNSIGFFFLDGVCSSLSIKLGFVSKSLKWLIIILALASIFSSSIPSVAAIHESVSSALCLVADICVFIKLYLAHVELPEHGIRLSARTA